jgi:hypothetical protein
VDIAYSSAFDICSQFLPSPLRPLEPVLSPLSHMEETSEVSWFSNLEVVIIILLFTSSLVIELSKCSSVISEVLFN